MRVWLAVMTIATAVALSSSHASAEEEEDDDAGTNDAGFIGRDIAVLEIDDCPAQPQVSPDQLRNIGSEHFERGAVLYRQGDYKGAVKELVAAYCIFPFYSILKDIGQAYERELEYELAIAYLERYVLAMPRDAKKLEPCDDDPQIDKQNVLARIKTLQALRAKILVNTDPADADITLLNETGVRNRGVAGQQLEVSGGRYQVLIERKGYHPVTQEIRAEIGKPYTLFAKLDPRRGEVRVRLVPPTARLFVDQKQVEVIAGAYVAQLPAGKYSLQAESPDRVTVTRDIELIAEDDLDVALELPERPQGGRRQFIGWSTLAGGLIGGTLAGASSDDAVIGAGIAIGLAGGFFGSYFITPRDIPLGTSSLTITSSLIGGTLGGASALVVTGDGNRVAPSIGGGMLLGGFAGYYFASRFNISPGDAAVINSGALWGTVVGSLFSGSFEATSERRIGAGLVLSGLGMGTLGGVLMTRYFNVSRTRAALIDVGGVIGVFVGIAIENVASQAAGTDSEAAERTANYTLGGLATGLILAGILTRNVDAPKISISPTVSKTGGPNPATTLGLSGSF